MSYRSADNGVTGCGLSLLPLGKNGAGLSRPCFEARAFSFQWVYLGADGLLLHLIVKLLAPRPAKNFSPPLHLQWLTTEVTVSDHGEFPRNKSTNFSGNGLIQIGGNVTRCNSTASQKRFYCKS